MSTWFNVWATSISGSICTERELITLDTVKSFPLHQGSNRVLLYLNINVSNRVFWERHRNQPILVNVPSSHTANPSHVQGKLQLLATPASAAGSSKPVSLRVHMFTRHWGCSALCKTQPVSFWNNRYSLLDPVKQWKKLLQLGDGYHRLPQGFWGFLNSLQAKLTRLVSQRWRSVQPH